MKKFNFRLQPLLRLRQLEEDQKKRLVGQLMAQINENQQQALQMAYEIKRQGRELKHQFTRGKVDFSWISHYYGYVNWIHQSIAQRIEKVAQIQKHLSVARQELTQAKKRTRTLEKIKEKRKERYDYQVHRLETHQQDEIGTNIYMRISH